jgi:pimeloyl-ACP methyl ester carboxylesterase
MPRAHMVAIVLMLLGPSAAAGQDVRPGVVVDEITSPSDPGQSYALYVPSGYTPDRTWSLLLAFHPGARGKAMVEKYQAAAEQYGYIVAGSNTSRNGPWEASIGAVRAMSLDLGRRFSIDPQRVYVTGLSGGARVALQVALAPANKIAGVIASSAGYPDSQPRSTVPFPVFSTAGSEDFNYIEMRRLDRKLTSPHFLAVFDGGHTLPPDEVAMEAIEWLELQAIRSKRRPPDDALIARLFDQRLQQADASTNPAAQAYLLDAIVVDFADLRDVAPLAARARQLAGQAAVKKAIAKERDADDEEWRTIGEIFDLETRITDRDARLDAMARLRGRLAQLSRTAAAADPSSGRSQARRLLGAVASGVRQRSQDPEYLKLVEQYAYRPGR